ncbi:C-terminal binding protein [Nocardia sp. NPDC052566]|uniref:C-terminal binding protein n=1 Tax=Nocardia sp. NPDC052566 TaxID=3364330 RepID=UPI0037C626F2
MASAGEKVLVIDAPGGGYVEVPDIETEVIGAHGEVRLEIISDGDLEPLYAAEPELIILWHRVALDAAFFDRIKTCRAVICASVGYDHVDIAAARRNDVAVYYVPDYGTEEVADHTLALGLSLARRLPALDGHVRDGGWDWRAIGPARRLRDRVWGIVGLGRIGTAVALRARALGMRVAFYDPYNHPGIEKGLGYRRAHTLTALLAEADIVSLHVPLTRETRHLLGDNELAAMKDDAVLVNTARGPVIDLDALRTALAASRPGYVGLDVVDGEPRIPQWLSAHPRALLTPHAAFYSVESLTELRTRAAEAARQLLTGAQLTSAIPVPATNFDD